MATDIEIKMQSIIDRHMAAAFEEMERTLGDTPNEVRLYIMQAYEQNGIDSTCAYQCCSVSLNDEQIGGNSRHGL